MDTEIKAGVRRNGDGWTGVIRQGKAVIYDCGHWHNNRDTSSRVNGLSASTCVGRIVDGARRPFMAPRWAAEIVSPEGQRKYLDLVEQFRALLPGEAA